MKRIVFSMLIAIMVSLSFSAYGQNGGWLISTGNSVRVRYQPSLSAGYYSVRMNKGQSAHWFDYRDGWYKIRIGQDEGWVSAQYMRNATQDQAARWVWISGDRVILRLSPGGKDSGLRAYTDDTYRYCGHKGEWYKIRRGKHYYWVSSQYSWLTGDM